MSLRFFPPFISLVRYMNTFIYKYNLLFKKKKERRETKPDNKDLQILHFLNNSIFIYLEFFRTIFIHFFIFIYIFLFLYIWNFSERRKNIKKAGVK